jgi:hypothetical protein
VADKIEHPMLSAVPEFSDLRPDLQQQLVDFVDKGILNYEADAKLIESVLLNDLEASVLCNPADPMELWRLTKVVGQGVPMVARGTKINMQSYMRSKTDQRRRL